MMTYTFDAAGALLETDLPLPGRRGKVRDVYDLGETLLVVSTDRISAFDWILPSGIPDKGKLLTAMSAFWFGRLEVPHHLLSLDLPERLRATIDLGPLEGRSMIVRKAEVVPFECVVRGYLEGSGWREYQEGASVCGIDLPAGLRQCEALAEPIFTPATKAETGHDQNVAFEVMSAAIGAELAKELREASLKIYQDANQHAQPRGILIADTKFEFGMCGDHWLLIDEVLTPDSSRFWDAATYQPGKPQPSFDKQFVREWLSETDWDRNSPPPELPSDVIEQTGAKYREAYRRLTE